MAMDKGICSLYKDKEGKWRWRAVAKNGNIVAASCQGYVNKQDCINNAKMLGYNSCKEE